MIVISKQVFEEKIINVNRDVSCDLIHVWEPDCVKAHFSRRWLFNVLAGSGKFFIPVYLIKLLMNCNKKDKKTLLLDFLRAEIRSIGYGWAMETLFISTICLLRKLFGRFYYSSVVFLPGFLSGLALIVETTENQVLDGLIFFNSYIETILNSIGINRVGQTIMFMGVSSFLMHILANRKNTLKFVYFWFYTPPMKNNNSENKNTCAHEEACSVYFYKGFFKFFSLGYGVNIIRRLVPKMGILMKKPSNIFRLLISKSNVYFGLFIGSYVGLYRVLTCYMTKTFKMKEKYFSSIAGLFCGLTYAVSPNIQVLVIAITTVLQIIYHNISEHFKVTNHFWQRLLLFMCCHGYLLHQKFLNPKICSPYYSKMIDACTNNMKNHPNRRTQYKVMPDRIG
ncbi:hypothetical protein JTB14_007207 [Gonioctena quinquepunctata]|nr:hypothetical protein JTB14_007207 [Gonioctena quinquepunctata]